MSAYDAFGALAALTAIFVAVGAVALWSKRQLRKRDTGTHPPKT